MPYQPTGRSSVAPSFTQPEWDLLVRLPGRVLIAATSVERDIARHTVAEGIAGIEAIAAGRASPSRLVHDVVAAIYAEQAADDDQPPVAAEFADPRAGIAGVLAQCRAATRALERHAFPDDAAAYRAWLVQVATCVCAAARAGDVFGLVDREMGAAERRFLDDVSSALTI